MWRPDSDCVASSATFGLDSPLALSGAKAQMSSGKGCQQRTGPEPALLALSGVGILKTLPPQLRRWVLGGCRSDKWAESTEMKSRSDITPKDLYSESGSNPFSASTTAAAADSSTLFPGAAAVAALIFCALIQRISSGRCRLSFVAFLELYLARLVMVAAVKSDWTGM